MRRESRFRPVKCVWQASQRYSNSFEQPEKTVNLKGLIQDGTEFPLAAGSVRETRKLATVVCRSRLGGVTISAGLALSSAALESAILKILDHHNNQMVSTAEWFLAMDRNRDGDISSRKFIGDSMAFQRLDRDGDRLISLDDYLKIYLKKFKQGCNRTAYHTRSN
ncbi:hypothetical protein CA54_58460 [Symmachiella macrocystis]|uniref:EF hand n=1 Tax=Symmachiella macrocystis TaxID=2527985 RepID=A0A5C6AZS9_9PLAN|nr:EF-hand domain-containing protein [Symmachiella macrocystis]TWU05158.1 hypothetical protein CA54_58460 [Symmachiella macrocystis]